MANFSYRLLTGAAAAALLSVAAGPALAQDARDTLRVAMYSKAPPRGNTYAIQYIWPSMYWWEGVFDSFVRINDKAEILPFAAEKWELVNPTTWRVTFRKDAEFTSGRKNDAANVVKIFEYLHSEAGKPAGIMRNMKLVSYKAVDSHTVEFVTPQPDPLLVAKFAAFYISDMTSFNEMGAANFAGKPVTSGPWQVTSWNEQEMNATAYAKSWRPAKIKNLRIVEVPEQAARRAAIESGQMDLSFNMTPDDIPHLRAAGHDVVITGGPLVEAIALFTKDFANKWGGKPPFADKRVRLAANLAFNRDAFTKDFFKGVAKPASQPATPAINGYNPDVKPYPYDPARARQLLTEAGYPNGLNLIMESSGGIAGGRETLQIIGDDLGKVGIKVETRVMPFATWSQIFNSQKWAGDMSTFAMFHSPVMDAAIPFSVYGCDLPHGITCIPELNDLIKAQDQEMDPVKRRVLLRELMKRANEEVLALPVIEGADVTAVAKRIKNFKNWSRVVVYEDMTIDG
jgi:peptide/nickel transport system substrate-binding protein